MKKVRRDWKILFPAMVILSIGTIYLVLQLIDLLSSESNLLELYRSNGKINWQEMLFDLRTFIYIFLGLTGGFGLLQQKKWGWILGVPYLILYVIICSWGIVRIVAMDMMNEGGYLLIGICLGLFAALACLLNRSTINTLKLTRPAFLASSLIMILLLLLYFYLQL